MDIEALIWFVSVADEHSFSRAADEQNISQSSLSKAIIRLENELNVHLFDRKVHPIRLTAEGEIFYEDARRIIPLYYQAIRHLKPYVARRKVNLHVYPADTTQSLRYIIDRYHTDHHNIRVEMNKDDTFEEAVNRLRTGVSDYLIAHEPCAKFPELCMTYLADDPVVVVVPENHPLAAREAIFVDDLNGVDVQATRFGAELANELAEHYGIRYGSVRYTPGVRRDAVLYSIRYEEQVMICYKRDIDMFNLEHLRQYELQGIQPKPYVMMELRTDSKPQYQREFREYLLTNVATIFDNQ